MSQPADQRKVDSRTQPAIIDAFLDWTHRHRAPDTYEWYRYRLQRFVDQYPVLTLAELKPFHVEQWLDG